MGTGSFPGWSDRGINQPPPFSAEVKESLVLYLSLSAFMAGYSVNFAFTCGVTIFYLGYMKVVFDTFLIWTPLYVCVCHLMTNKLCYLNRLAS